MKMMTYKMNSHIQNYINLINSGKKAACKEQKQLVKHIEKCFKNEDIYTNEKQLESYLALVKYFPYDELFDWEIFCLALHCCTYRKKDNMPRWPDLFALMGRGGGKDGYIAFESFCLVSHYNGIKGYNVDICANNEAQAKAPFNDIYDVLDTPGQTGKLKKHFYWNKEEIVNLKTKSKIKYRTNSPKGKDGLRSGIVILNEIHQYENYKNINVFTTGLGKKKHPRRTYATTNGDVREGPLDHYLEQAEEILTGAIPDDGFLPFICKLDNKKEVDNPKNWEKANPSLIYLPNLRAEIEKEYKEWKKSPTKFSAFMTKRMNIPDGDKDRQVTDWENIIATKKELPNLEGRSAVVGIDYAKISDFASVNFHFRDGDKRYDISHSWLCLKSNDLSRIKAPWKQWADEGLLTLVDDVEINPDLLIDYIAEMATKYEIMKISLDSFRYALLSKSLRNIGYDAKEFKNIYLIRPSDIMKVYPVIDSCFNNQNFIWGDNPVLRWATNNTKSIRSSRKAGSDTGNFYYGKIEAKSRKTDPFMALVASMVSENDLGDCDDSDTPDLGVFTF